MTTPSAAGVLEVERALNESPQVFNALVASLDTAARVSHLGALLAQLERREENARALHEARERSYQDELARLHANQRLLQMRLQEAVGQMVAGTGRRSLTVPGVGRLGLRKSPGGWRIVDEGVLLASLSADERAQLVLSKPVIDRRKLKDYLDVCEAEGTIVPGVERTEEEDRLTFSKEASDAS